MVRVFREGRADKDQNWREEQSVPPTRYMNADQAILFEDHNNDPRLNTKANPITRRRFERLFRLHDVENFSLWLVNQ